MIPTCPYGLPAAHGQRVTDYYGPFTRIHSPVITSLCGLADADICREQAVRLIRGEIINDVTLVVTRQLAINRNVIIVRSGSDTAGQKETFNKKHTM